MRRFGLLVTFAVMFFCGCSALGSAPASNGTVSAVTAIASELCRDLGPLVDLPTWVQLECSSPSGGPAVTVRMPRKQWAAMRAAGTDAGPGL